MSYRVNEVFFSVQGEGVRAGTPNVFVRFTGCNLRCAMEPGDKSPGGFDCDTEFASGVDMTSSDLLEAMNAARGDARAEWCILTGGEPALQVTDALIGHLHADGWKIAIETNGTVALPEGIDWVTVSPKTAEHTLRQIEADEVKYLRAAGQGIPRTRCKAKHYLISPVVSSWGIDRKDLEWCIALVKENPQWRLSVQQHKTWKVR